MERGKVLGLIMRVSVWDKVTNTQRDSTVSLYAVQCLK